MKEVISPIRQLGKNGLGDYPVTPVTFLVYLYSEKVGTVQQPKCPSTTPCLTLSCPPPQVIFLAATTDLWQA